MKSNEYLNNWNLPGGGVCAFVRAYNDLDHLTPILFKIKQLNPKLNVDVIISDHRIDLNNDFRLIFLKKMGVSILYFYQLKIISNKIQKFYFFAQKKIKLMKRFDPFRILLKLMMIKIDKKVIKSKHSANIELLIKRIFSKAPKVFIFDQSRISFYHRLCNFARKKNIPTIAVPHGHTLLLNELHGDKYMQYKENKHPFNLKVKSPFDYTVFENEIIRNRYISYGTINKKNSVVLGSSRFSDEWMKIISKKIKNKNLHLGSDKKLKIVLMLSKISYNGFYDEIVRTIEFICQFPDVFLIVKPHTRNKSIKMPGQKNLYIDNDHTYHSTNLIEWSNLVIFEHSCISFHALKLDKPILYLSSTHANRLMSELYFTSWEARTRDDIRATIWRLLENPNFRTYSKKDAEKYIKNIIEPKGKDVLRNYVNFVTSKIASE